MTTTTADLTRLVPISRPESRELARTAYARFADLLTTVTDDQWSLPTDCPAWTIRDLAGHLVGAMRSAASLREMLSQQRAIAQRVKATGQNQVDVMTAIQVERTADLDPVALVAECRALVDRAATGRYRTPAPLRRLVSFHVEMGPISERWNLGYLVDTILTRDTWMHRIDLARALSVTPELDRDHDGRLIAHVAAEWARRHGQPVRLTLTGPAGGTYAAGTGGEQIEVDAVEFCRIVSGRAEGSGLLAQAVPF